MYLTLFHPDTNMNVLTMNFLRLKNVDFVVNGHYFFMEKSAYEGITKQYTDIILQSYDAMDLQVKYHILANNLQLSIKQVSHVFQDYSVQNFQVQDSFTCPASRSVFHGYMVSLFFKGSLISNPLDVIWKIAASLSYEQTYHGIFYDFIPVADGIIYQVTFHFTGMNLREKLSEVLKTKAWFVQNTWKIDPAEENGFGATYRAFQTHCLSRHPLAKRFTVTFVDTTIFAPESQNNLKEMYSWITQK